MPNSWMQVVDYLKQNVRGLNSSYLHIDFANDRVNLDGEIPSQTSTLESSPGYSSRGVYFTDSPAFAETMSQQDSSYRNANPPGNIYSLESSLFNDIFTYPTEELLELGFSEPRLLVINKRNSNQVPTTKNTSGKTVPDWRNIQSVPGLIGVKFEYIDNDVESGSLWFEELKINARDMENELVIWDKDFLQKNVNLVLDKYLIRIGSAIDEYRSKPGKSFMDQKNLRTLLKVQSEIEKGSDIECAWSTVFRNGNKLGINNEKRRDRHQRLKTALMHDKSFEDIEFC